MFRSFSAIFVVGVSACAAAAQAERPESADEMVYHAFPEADSTRRIVRDVQREVRAQLEQRLPFKVHFDELGPHTLYVAFRGRRPVGVLYVRTEEAEWGFTDIGWALSLDLEVLGFQFRRGRSRHLLELAKSPFAKDLVGRDYEGIRELLAATVRPGVPAGAEELAETCLRSAMKALLVTELVWREEVQKLADRAMGFDAFPAAERWQRDVIADAADGAPLPAASIMTAYGTGQTHLGWVVRGEAAIGGKRTALRWVVAPDLRLVRLAPMASWQQGELRSACSELEGQRLDAAAAGDNPLRPAAGALAAALRRLGETRQRR